MRYPLILVHGIAGSDRVEVLDFWGRIPEVLRGRGVRVFFGGTDAWGGFQTNAAILSVTIDEVLHQTRAPKVNLIAHSKGGLDCRTLLAGEGPNGRVASLLTVATPHRGSELADLVLAQPATQTRAARRAARLIGRLFLDRNPDPWRAAQDLSTEGMRQFNHTANLPDDVYFRSYYCAMENRFDDLLFFFSHRYLERLAGRNDGVVTAASANWGPDAFELKGVSGGLSHSEIIDFKRKPISGVDVTQFYLQMVNELEARGF